MASEEVKKILGNLQTLKDTKTGSGEVDKIAEIAQEIAPEQEQEELSEEDLLKKELEAAIAEEKPAPVEEKVTPVAEPTPEPKPQPVAEQPVEPSASPEQIIQAEVEALNNDGVFRHALLQRLSAIEQHLHVMAISAVKLGDVNLGAEDGQEGQ